MSGTCLSDHDPTQLINGRLVDKPLDMLGFWTDWVPINSEIELETDPRVLNSRTLCVTRFSLIVMWTIVSIVQFAKESRKSQSWEFPSRETCAALGAAACFVKILNILGMSVLDHDH